MAKQYQKNGMKFRVATRTKQPAASVVENQAWPNCHVVLLLPSFRLVFSTCLALFAGHVLDRNGLDDDQAVVMLAPAQLHHAERAAAHHPDLLVVVHATKGGTENKEQGRNKEKIDA